MTAHLESICTRETIAYEREALHAIAQESGGSLRDALNLLERLRIAYDTVTKGAVIEVMGSVDDDRVCQLLVSVMRGTPTETARTYEQLGFRTHNALIVWKKIVALLRSCLWLQYGIQPDGPVPSSELQEVAGTCSTEKLISFFELCYHYEPLFAKTAVPSTVLETMVLTMASSEGLNGSSFARISPTVSSVQKPVQSKSTPQKEGSARRVPNSSSSEGSASRDSASRNSAGELPTGGHSLNGSNASSSFIDTRSSSSGPIASSSPKNSSLKNSEVASTSSEGVSSKHPPLDTDRVLGSSSASHGGSASEGTDSSGTPWASCLRAIEKLKDPLIVSIFRQAAEPQYDISAKSVTITFPEDILFFKDMLENTKKSWFPLFARFYQEDIQVIPLFSGKTAKERFVRTVGGTTDGSTRPNVVVAQRGPAMPKNPKGEAQSTQISQDPEKWQKSSMILDLFPGTITTSDKESL